MAATDLRWMRALSSLDELFTMASLVDDSAEVDDLLLLLVQRRLASELGPLAERFRELADESQERVTGQPVPLAEGQLLHPPEVRRREAQWWEHENPTPPGT
ncbi:hypothetical protein [Streptomyces radicis]|uniref:Uncharacterized protein n=1 Tax=Streptomyces radicis TaxID=1750517 RepID=A0A3A9WJL2_9ACTN|nr:hypothetical protein [Streptomyces radicis]RKN12792.1 hypothetical protein D7319_02345 [Streptomyces radicis]RKN27443.1 hypothetical protein D7318_00550 [Streptomyces radicis]